MEKLVRDLLLAAIAEAADVMDAVDPDDRTAGQKRLVGVVQEWVGAANGGDTDKLELILMAVPSWRTEP